MVTFYIDYDNVQSNGLLGIELLHTDDKVYICYTNTTPKKIVE